MATRRIPKNSSLIRNTSQHWMMNNHEQPVAGLYYIYDI